MIDLRQMRRERQKGVQPEAGWFQRPFMNNSLKLIGISLILFVLTSVFGYSLAFHISLSVINSSIASIGLVVVIILMIIDVRKNQFDRAGGRSVVWYQRLRMLRYLAFAMLLLGFLFLAGDIQYHQAYGFPVVAFPWDTLVDIFIVLCWLGAGGLYLLVSVRQRQ